MDAIDEASAAEAEVLALWTKIEEKRKRLREIREEEETTEREVRELQEALEKALERREKAVKEREERMRQVHERVEEAAEKAKGRMDLNVGGRVFSFTTETLAKYPESFFGRLVSGRWENKDKGKKKRKADDIETVFVERPDGPFRHIAAFLITDHLKVELSEMERDALLDECDFFGLDELSNLIKPEKKQKQVGWNFVAHEGFENCLKQEGNTYTNVSDEENGLKGSELWESGVHRWKVRVDKVKDVWIGLCDGLKEGECWVERGATAGSTFEICFDADARTLEFRWTDANGKEHLNETSNIPAKFKSAYCALDPGDQITLLETD